MHGINASGEPSIGSTHLPALVVVNPGSGGVKNASRPLPLVMFRYVIDAGGNCFLPIRRYVVHALFPLRITLHYALGGFINHH